VNMSRLSNKVAIVTGASKGRQRSNRLKYALTFFSCVYSVNAGASNMCAEGPTRSSPEGM
jgi:hypothetical protein